MKLARRVTHPNVVRTYDLGEFVTDDGETRLFLTMEYVDGVPLGRMIHDVGPMVPARIEPLLQQICAGLSAAHDAGVVHRDLKPDNVLVTGLGRAVLTDFGIACVASGTELVRTVAGLLGTPAYMSPEQARGGEVDHRADLYALGAILFEMLTGEPAWSGEVPMQVALARVLRAPPDPRALRPDIPPRIAEVVLRCMAVDPAARFQTARAVASAWSDALPGAPTMSPRATDAGEGKVATTARIEVPHDRARTLAVLPFRASTADDDAVARGLAEELVDAFSMTRGLRVRPIGQHRNTEQELEARELGRRLGVEIVVDGTVRRSAGRYRVSIRTINVADGYQLGAWRFESEDPLAIVDDVAATVARTLTLDDLPTPVRTGSDPRAIDLYLRGKQELRSHWFVPSQAFSLLGEAHGRAPDDPDILAAFALAATRQGLFGRGDQPVLLERARVLAERAVAVGPDRGEAWFALAAARLYSVDPVGAAGALKATLVRSPGHAQAQEMLGGLLLEAGAVPEAMLRLRTAASLDPSIANARYGLARGHALLGEWDRTLRLLEGDLSPSDSLQRALVWARLRTWNTELPPIPPYPPEEPVMPEARRFVYRSIRYLDELVRLRALPAGSIDVLSDGVEVEAGRLRVTRMQFYSEALLFAGETAAAFEVVARATELGLVDLLWLDRCPLLLTLHRLPAFATLRRIVADRAAAIAVAGR